MNIHRVYYLRAKAAVHLGRFIVAGAPKAPIANIYGRPGNCGIITSKDKRETKLDKAPLILHSFNS